MGRVEVNIFLRFQNVMVRFSAKDMGSPHRQHLTGPVYLVTQKYAYRAVITLPGYWPAHSKSRGKTFIKIVLLRSLVFESALCFKTSVSLDRGLALGVILRSLLG